MTSTTNLRDATKHHPKRNSRWRAAVLSAALIGSAGTVALAPSQPASAAMTFAANSWGECNTSRPASSAGLGTTFFDRLITNGRPANYRYTSCRYWTLTDIGWVPVFKSVNWWRACKIEIWWTNNFKVWVRTSDNTVWCTV